MIEIYTDGACEPNPGPGGVGVVVIENGAVVKTHAQAYDETTSNRMEITAAATGLMLVPRNIPVVLYSDSQYLINTMTQGWKRKKNHDLWARLDELVLGRQIHWVWVRGHDGNPFNEQADVLAVQAMNSASIFETFKDTGFSQTYGRSSRFTHVAHGSAHGKNQKFHMRPRRRRKKPVQALSTTDISATRLSV